MNQEWPHNISELDNATASHESQPVFTQAGMIAYGTIMTLVLSVGFFGNTITLVVLAHREHRQRNITPYLANNAAANLLIVIFGYPVAISANLQGEVLLASTANCNWSSFVNGSTGIASIITLATLSFVLKMNVARMNRAPKSTLCRSSCIIAGIWIYSTGLMVPPLLGWNSYVPGAARFSCCPDWSSRDITDILYNVFLICMGFVIPLTVIVFCFYTIWRFLRPPLFKTRKYDYRTAYSRDVVRLTVFSIITFTINWSPYCALSIAAMLKGKYATTTVWAQFPELMAKSSVIYNPIILLFTYTGFRHTFHKVICKKLFGKGNLDESFWGRWRTLSATSQVSHQSHDRRKSSSGSNCFYQVRESRV